MQRRGNGEKTTVGPKQPEGRRNARRGSCEYHSEVNMGVPGHKGLPLLISFVSVGLRRGSITTILGLEKENPKFLGKIRKRREKIVDKGLLETSRFERELKRSKRKVIKSVIRSQKVDLFCIQETKMQVMSEEVVRSLGPGRFLDWKRANSPFPVDLGMWEMEQSGCSQGFMVLVPERIGSVYGRSLGAIRGLWEEPWCLGGDFNSTLFQAERSRNGRITSTMRRFAQIVDELGLVDTPLQGGSFTWSGGLNNQSWPGG
ncbi:hypothetical protein CK203_063872 [Vitis vinifera]|uniref:Endonuclease/exonuclease/phosphatase domain-containing protein n=1 Tax=Vitis vinifera TaxID=29760 RepID=A0A438G2W6_VITVI|nr:hypothetical protein CK203_063872 [Vitis vinifera]